jgi:radical SAM superfamily enzyme YgiQ (UPF0313 family)
MKISLVNPPYLKNYGRLNVGRNFNFPMGLGYVAACLEQAGHAVEIIEPEILGMTDREIGDHFREYRPDLVGFTCTTSTVNSCSKISEIAKATCNCKTLIGGVHASALPEVTMRQFPTFDFLSYGEGEYMTVELVDRMETAAPDYSGVLGLAYREGSDVVLNAPRPAITEMDSIPLPARHLVDLHQYRPQPLFYKGLPYATINTSRGCPAKCTFCASFNSLGYRLRPHSSDYVVEEIDILVNKYGMRHLHFVDDTFTMNKKRAADICEKILNRDYRIIWHCFARVNTVDEELLRLMKQAGCFSILFGIETGDMEIMKNIKKGITLDQARETLAICNRLGLKTECGFMFGNRGDTRETIEKTLKFAIELKPTIASFNIMVPFPGTEDYKDTYGDNHPDNWDDFICKGTTTLSQVEGLTSRQLKSFQTYAFWTFYLRPSQIHALLRQTSNAKEVFGYMRGALGLAMRSLEWRFK